MSETIISETIPELPRQTRCGFVALIGAPNAGKSTLLNALVGAKVSIVTRKAQTTRTQVRGIVLEGEAQLIFVDTPGLFAPKRRLDRAMVASAWSGAADADVVGLLVDARKGLTSDAEELLTSLANVKRPKVLILNKIDLIERSKLLELSAAIHERHPFIDTFMISAMKGSGVDDLRRGLAKHMAPGPWLYPEDQIADAPLRFLAAEITREKIFERLHDEIPYQCTVETETWQAKKDGSVKIEQVIYVARESQRKIMLGEKGQTIKAVGSAARLDIAEAAETNVHLFLFVKVRENWESDPERYREMKLEYSK
jgi:GTPase